MQAMGAWRLQPLAAALLLLHSVSRTAAAASCPDRSVVTTDCSAVCPSTTVVCVQYSTSASPRVERTASTAEYTVDDSGCVSRCLTTTVDPLTKILHVRVPGGAPIIEDMAALTLPTNVTGLDLTSDATAMQTSGFPDENIVATGTLLNYLGLHKISPETLPPSVYDLPLETLRLSHSSPSGLSPAVTRFKTIHTLILDHSKLATFPVSDVIGDMPQVRSLSLTANAITEIPLDETAQALYVASALEELALGENNLSDFGAKFPSLRVLDLHGNQLTRLPTSLNALPKLYELRLDGNPLDSTQLAAQLVEIPPQSELTLLTLSPCGLNASLPAGFAKVFNSLTHLDLAQNGLASIGPGELPEDSLVFLNVSANQLTSFSGSFQRLETLDISHNQLESLNFSDLTNLEILDLRNNKLTAFPASLVWTAPQLKVLRLSGNPAMAPFSLRTTDQFDKLQNLTELSVDPTTFNSTLCQSDWLLTSTHGVSVCVIPSSDKGSKRTTTTTTTTTSSSNADSRMAGVITTIVLTIGAIVFGVVACLQSKKRRRTLPPFDDSQLHHHDSDTAPYDEPPPTSQHATGAETTGRTKATSTASSTTSSAKLWADDSLLQLQLPLDSIRFFKVVGMGGYGQVWRGTCRTSATESCHVAIKTLAPDRARDRETVRQFLSQIKVQASLSHIRIVTVVGIAWHSTTDLCALLEFMPRGDLFATLHYSSSSSCSSSSTLFQPGVWGESKLQIALDIVDALSFLHAQSPLVIHRDLKSRNVLLDAHGRAKLSDVGVADSPTRVSPLWTAPEVLIGRSTYDEKADVFSFGVILSELDTHEIPYGYEGSATTMQTSTDRSRSRHPRGHESQQQQLLRQIASGEIHPKFLPSCPSAIYEIAQKCLAPDPAIRPSAVDINIFLRRVERDGSDVRMSTVL